MVVKIDMEVMNVVLIAFIVLVLYLSLGGPLPLCFGAALMVMHFVGGIEMQGLIMQGLYEITNPVMLSIPLFIFAGKIMGESGIAKSLLDFVNLWVGRIKGGLGVVSIVTCAVLGAISGSALTGIAAVGPIMIPRMETEGYPRGYATGLVTISSILGLLIPPSITMILYGWVSETSILACFVATFIPGLIVTLAFSIMNIILSKKFNLHLEEELRGQKRIAEIKKRTFAAIPALIFPTIILGGIYGGVMTTTEAAAVSVVYALIVGFCVYKGLRRSNFVEAAMDSCMSVASIMLMITVCLILGQTLTLLGTPQTVSRVILNFSNNVNVILFLVNILFIIMGMLVTDAVSVLLAVPLLLPAVVSLGISPVHFGAIVGVNLAMGVVTPPYASALFLGIRVGKAEFTEVLKPLMMFLCIGYVPVLILTTYFPELSLFLPRLLGLIR
jgi:tripartite ATP-independent transporter DctM subunit